MTSTPRPDPFAIAPDAMAAMLDFEVKTRALGLDPSLCHLIKIRASQINGCSYCLDMHEREALQAGETTARIGKLAKWQDTDVFSDRERAALVWTDTLTSVSHTHAPDVDYDLFSKEFTPVEQVKVTLVIAAINSWNRLAIGFRMGA